MRIFQAGPLFSEAERAWHRQLKTVLTTAGHDVVWAYELFEPEAPAAWGADAPRRIMDIDRAALETCSVVIALLDGAQVDDGTAWEIGYAFAKGLPVVGVRTDFRRGGETAYSCVNAMIQGSCVAVVYSVEEVLEALSFLSKNSH